MDKKKFKISLLLTLIFLGLGFFNLTQAVDYPNLPGVDEPGTGLTQLLTYIFSLGLFIGVIIVAGALIYGGFLYLTSAGNSQRITAAKNIATNATFGLLILLTSFLILNTINPQLVETPFDISTPTTTQPINPKPPTEVEATTTFQEIPIGTLTQKLLAKEIDCYRGGEKYETIVDCQDKKELDTLVNERDARRGYCYDFKEEDGTLKFKDADPDTNQIDPMTEHDRMDCITKFREPVNEKMKKLERWSEKIKNLTQNGCNCKQCTVDGNCKSGTCSHTDCREGTCHPKTSCKGKPYESGDPCNTRNQIDEYRKKIRRNYEDKELKKMTVDKFNKLAADTPEEHGDKTLLVADQVRFLMVNFLKPLEKDLEKDLSYLRDAENFLKTDCPYKTVTSLSNYYFFKEEESMNWGKKEFCKEGTTWRGNCSQKNKVDITKYCKDFNVKNCTTTDEEKLPCFQCDLDKLEKGDCATSTLGQREIKTCKPSDYLLNNQTGSSTCTTTDATCTLCKIEDEKTGDKPEQVCEKGNDDPATFYCPNPNSEDVPGSIAPTLGKTIIDPEPQNRYPRGLIPIGDAADGTEKYGQLILDELKNINNRIKKATNALFNPYKPAGDLKDKPKGDLSVLYVLPLSCRCQENPDQYWGASHCLSDCKCAGQAGCCDPYSCNCDDDGCEKCCSYQYCSPCNCKCPDKNPCLMGAIKDRYSTVKTSKNSSKNSFKRIVDLVEVKSLKKNDPNRNELITMLSQSRDKMQKCLTGFEDVNKEEMNLQGIISCSLGLDLLKLGQIDIQPSFPILNYNNCYPPEVSLPDLPNVQNSCYPYSHEKLTDDQKENCLSNQKSDECREAIRNLGKNGGMNNFFCTELRR